ncbi:hypothetical protein C0J52_22906 [Blattella germanica]|nr:hypothetical protein C0J52_22906 [Blattella germanica]
MDDNGFPAPNNSRKGLSAAEFQRNLYNWFEKQGLLDDLRAQLRHQMVTALRSTSLGPGPSKRTNVTVSPKIHSINLLIAEFLLHHDHHYSLSVFTSEVPLLRSMPEFTKSGTQVSGKSNSSIDSAPRFHHHDVKDILESFGLHLESEIGNRIFTQYQDSTEGIALLTCILQNVADNRVNNQGRTVAPSTNELPSQNSQSSTNLKDTTNSEKEVRAIKKLKEMYKAEMKEIVYQSQLKSQHIKQLQEEIRRFQETEVEKVRKEEEAKFQKELVEREARIQAELNLHDEVIAQKVEDAEKKIAKQRQTLENEIKIKQQKLSEHATRLQDQHLDLTHKLCQVEEREEQLKREERRIEEVKQRDSVHLNAERETMSYVQLQLEDSRRQLIEARQSLAHSQSEVTFLRNIQQQCNHLRYELDATRFKLDNLAERQMHSPSEVVMANNQQRPVEMIDKGLQIALSQRTKTVEAATSVTPPQPEPQPSEPEKISSQDLTLDLEQIQSQQKLQQQQFEHLTDVLRRVQRENEELRGHTQQQRLRIDELTSHAAELANQLEDAHTAITLLSNHSASEQVPGPADPRMLQPIYLSSASGTITVPPLLAPPPPPPPPPLPAQVPRPATQSRQLGAGEELNYVTPPPPTQQPPISFGSSSSHSNTSHRREWRKKPPRRLMVYSNSNSSDETSPTEEILQEARRRLRKLEEESEAVDRSYQNFRRRHENLGVTTSLLFHPVLPPPPPPPPMQYGSTLGYGCYTSSRPFYSSATGTSHTPIIYSNFNYGNSPSSVHLSSSLLNPLISNTTSRLFPPMYQSSFTGASGSQYAFPPRSQMSGIIGNISSSISGRIPPLSRNQDLSTVMSSQSRFVTDPLETRFTLPPQPTMSIGHPSNRILQAKDKTGSPRSRIERSNSISQVNRLDDHAFSSEPYNPQHLTKTVTFASPLKTTMVYTTPQVSSSIGNSSKQPDNNGALTTASYTSDRPITSAIQNASKAENYSKNSNKETNISERTSLINERDTIEIEHFSENNRQEHDQESHLTENLSTDNIWQVRHFSPSLESEIPIKDSKSDDKNMAGPTNEIMSMDSSSIQRIFPVSDTSKSHTTFSDEPHPSGSFVMSETTDGGSNDFDIHPVFPVCNMSGSTFSSSVKEHSLQNTSTDRESLIQQTTENDVPHKTNIDHMPAQEEEMISEKSGSGTQTQITVQNKEDDVSLSNTPSTDKGNIRTVLSISQDLIGEAANFEDKESSDHHFKEVENIENIPFSTNDDRIVDKFAGSNNVLVTSEVIQEQLPALNLKESVENIQSVSDFGHVFNPPNIVPKILTSSKATEKSKYEISTEEDSEAPISLGDTSKKEDSSQDDFW